MGSGLVRACWIRICSGTGGSLEGIWGSPKLWSNILLGTSFSDLPAGEPHGVDLRVEETQFLA